MKEVTRIHIAKVSYDIEIVAKKELQHYIEALNIYAEDVNVLEDIEIRITELLGQRGVQSNGIITGEDVSSIREILGEPVDFSGEGDMAIGPDDDILNPSRRLYRDIDHAVFGGVLAGIAQFFKINAMWVRLVFVVLVLLSFGFAILAYIILWIVTPVAKTVTEKLQMRAEPVTLGSIRRYNEGEDGIVTTEVRLHRRRRIFGGVIGLFGAGVAVLSVIATVGASIAWQVYMNWNANPQSDQIIFGLIIACGVLLAVLGVIVAYGGFTAKATKRIIVSGAIVIIAGILSFSAIIGVASFGSWQQREAIQKSIKASAVTLPVNFAQADSITLSTDADVFIDYYVSKDFRATFSGLPGVSVKIDQTGGKLNLSVDRATESRNYAYSPNITIYGPALKNIDIDGGMMNYTATAQTQNIVVTMTGENNKLNLFGSYAQLTANLKNIGTINAEGASVKAATVTMQPNATVFLGHIDTLTVTQPTSCPNDALTQLYVESIRSETMTFNAAAINSESRSDACGIIVVGGSDNERVYRPY